MGGLKSPYRLKTTQNKNNTKMKAVIYARVSSTGERQSTERQILDLKAYSDKNSIEVVKTFEEHISGAKSPVWEETWMRSWPISASARTTI